MNITTAIQKDDFEFVYEFSKDIRVDYYCWSEPLIGPPYIRYYICTRDGITGLYNKTGDFLYDVTGIPIHLIENTIEDRAYYNWRMHPKKRTLQQERITHKAMSWGSRCLTKYAGSIVLFLTKEKPNTPYKEFISIISNEGYRVSTTNPGFLEPDPTKKQI